MVFRSTVLSSRRFHSTAVLMKKEFMNLSMNTQQNIATNTPGMQFIGKRASGNLC